MYMLFIGNIIGDYVSLVETRYILKIATRYSNIMYIGLLVFDVLITFVIYLTIGVGLWFLVNSKGDVWIISDFTGVITSFTGLTPFLYSTYTTSIIFYIFIFNLLFIKLLGKFSKPIIGSLNFISNSNNPVKSMVATLAAVVLILGGFKSLL